MIFEASNKGSKEWLLARTPSLCPEGPRIRAGGVEHLQRMLKATAWFPKPKEEPATVLQRLEKFNLTLKTSSWRVIMPGGQDTGRQETDDQYILIFMLPESQARALADLDFKPWLDLGRIHFKVARRGSLGEGVKMEVDSC